MPRTLETPPDKLLAALAEHDPATVADLGERLGVSQRTVQRRVRVLLDAGVLMQLVRGTYTRASGGPSLSEDGQELVDLIEQTDADAHVTGYDVLAGYAHQFVYDYAHLVYCHPPHLSGLASALTDAGWQVLRAGVGARYSLGGERTVVVRGQSHAPERYPVKDHVAAPEKAWVDLLRELRRSRLAFDYGELGRILNSLERAGGRLTVLEAYARRAGYLDWVRATRGQGPATNASQRELAAGYAA